MNVMEMKKKFRLSPVFSLHNGVSVLERSGDCIKIGMLRIHDEELKERLERAVSNFCYMSPRKYRTEFIELSQEEFSKSLASLFSAEKEDSMETGQAGKNDEKDSGKTVLESENTAAALLNSLIESALSLGASDIHVEQNGVRFRIRGRLESELNVETETRLAMVRRIKLLSGLNISECRQPQDGHFVFARGDGETVAVRVSCMPAVTATESVQEESVVLRLLSESKLALELECLGFDLRTVQALKKAACFSDGFIAVCGATGSGKSTTAAALLMHIARKSGGSKKIISLEDPPEYLLKGITQVHVNEKQGIGFAELLKRCLRQDPDVIMVGEIRDEETARIAVQAALTGHLVIATVHAASISQCVLRLNDLGQSAKMVNEVLRAVVCQKNQDGQFTAKIQLLIDEKKEMEVAV